MRVLLLPENLKGKTLQTLESFLIFSPENWVRLKFSPVGLNRKLIERGHSKTLRVKKEIQGKSSICFILNSIFPMQHEFSMDIFENGSNRDKISYSIEIHSKKNSTSIRRNIESKKIFPKHFPHANLYQPRWTKMAATNKIHNQCKRFMFASVFGAKNAENPRKFCVRIFLCTVRDAIKVNLGRTISTFRIPWRAIGFRTNFLRLVI